MKYLVVGGLFVISALFFSSGTNLFGQNKGYIKSAVSNRASEEKTITLLFTGDIMLDRYIRTVSEKKGGEYLFSCVANTLEKADILVGNLEGPITPQLSVSVGSEPGGENNYTFTFATSSASLLKMVGFDVLNIGNNHSRDFGEEGVKSTITYLREANLEYFGDVFENKVLKKEVSGIKLAFINYNEFGGSKAETLDSIKSFKEDGYLPFVYTHWGDEYEIGQPRLVNLAHNFIDAGAEIVIGSHPHVIGDIEEYGGKRIYYSLGNFIFDQYWSESVRNGLMVSLRIDKKGIKSQQEILVDLERDGRTCLSDRAK